uniref:NADH-ubiquinone oxidoreductase chain 6 n=1 Tax=Medon apicalis TaxID=347397 RepID=A0A0S2M7S4_9COLE|nr:NADH deshydrogenase subunit 6 [Medon apicalis]
MLTLSLIFSMMFFLMNHPLSMGMILLSQTIMTSLISGMLYMNFWFSYILFLIMIGGMLVLFIYMTSIASNEIFKFSMKIMIMMSMLMMLTMFMIYYMDIFNNTYLNLNNTMIENYMNLSLNKFINYPSNFILFLMIIYLFITLIAVVKITNMNSGPLRQKF